MQSNCQLEIEAPEILLHNSLQGWKDPPATRLSLVSSSTLPDWKVKWQYRCVHVCLWINFRFGRRAGPEFSTLWGKRESKSWCNPTCPPALCHSQMGPLTGLTCLRSCAASGGAPSVPQKSPNTKHVILVIDYMSRYCITKVVVSVTSKHIIWFFEDQIVWRFGPPEKLVTDQGSMLMCWEFHLYLETSGIEHCHTTTYHPCCNSLVERLARTLEVMLWQARGDRPVTFWDEPLNHVVLAYNTVVQETMREPCFS